MSERIEQRNCIKFCYKLGDTQVQTIQKIQQAFGDEAMGITQIKEWYNRFKQGQTSVESKPRSGRPSTSRNEEFISTVHRIVEDDRRITINEITEEVGVSTGSVHTIWPCDECLLNSFPSCWTNSRNNSAWKLRKTCLTVLTITLTS
ncbi:protein GVQW3-like [Palaemon carinicauda]|uniref:protein GVQW3-like n=1 Tax=Palaemon carinicauda TaxID=392227 RepID=UPI0035B677C5